MWRSKKLPTKLHVYLENKLKSDNKLDVNKMT